VGGPFLKPTFY